MYAILIVLMVITGIIFIGSVLLMSPKGGLGAAIGGVWQSSEYGSKKSLEGRLKYIALISGLIFVLVSLFLPYTFTA